MEITNNQKTYKASVYPGNNWNAPTTKSKNGLCLSGGGSRALSAGLGQLIGLRSLTNGNGGSLLDSVDYISSVSGGTWLTSIFTFSQNQNLDDLLGVYTAPDNLSNDNIGNLPQGSIGQVPGRLSYLAIMDILHEKIGFINMIKYPSVRKWMWPVIIGELVLKPYGLYNGAMVGTGDDITMCPERFFSLSLAYMEQKIKALNGDGVDNGSLTSDDFYFHQKGRPFPTLNTNIKLNFQTEDSHLLPFQANPIGAGATGMVAETSSTLTSDGGVESFGFSSKWQSQSGSNVMIDVERRYSLVDIVACSSAFFAEIVGKKMANAAHIFTSGVKSAGSNTIQADNADGIKESILADLASFVPQYNFWPVGPANPGNQNTGFADGGNLDNTGLVGMLARTDAKNIVVCYNAETPLGTSEDITVEGYAKKVALISTDIPPLFGFEPKPVNSKYVQFSDKTSADLTYLEAAQVFEPSAFGPLVTALFAASNGQKAPTSSHTPDLKVRDNTYAGIKNRGSVDVIWFYNNYAEDWVSEIHKNSWWLADKIRDERTVPLTDFHHFPNYNTATQLNLNATQVNALAQFQAWVINQNGAQIRKLFGIS